MTIIKRFDFLAIEWGSLGRCGECFRHLATECSWYTENIEEEPPHFVAMYMLLV